MLKLALKVRSLVLAVTGKLGWLPPTLGRITIGWLFLQTGWGKVHNLGQITEYFRSLGIPAPEIQAPFAAYTELVCGALILAGLFTRLASIPLIVTMTVALATAKKGDIHAVDDLFGIVEYLYIVVLAYLGVFGAGPVSLDHLLVRRVTPRCEPEAGLLRKEKVA
jgi:putative oxidoreductase